METYQQRLSRSIPLQPANQGFTLLEILVVLFIVSIMTGVAVINLPSFTQNNAVKEEAQRLRVVLDMLREESQLQANEYGFKPEHNGYQFLVYNEAQQSWDLLDEKPFSERALDEDVRLEVKVEGDELLLNDEEGAPPILILSSGEITPFEISLSSRSDTAQHLLLRSDGYGDIEISSDDH